MMNSVEVRELQARLAAVAEKLSKVEQPRPAPPADWAIRTAALILGGQSEASQKVTLSERALGQ